LKREVNRVFERGANMLFDIDVRGGLSIRRVYPKESVLIFIEPPSIGVLRERLRSRKTEDEETFRRRMDRVAMELELGKEFDFRVVNDTLSVAIEEVHAIVDRHLQSA
jgi:guanylate kinase